MGFVVRGTFGSDDLIHSSMPVSGRLNVLLAAVVFILPWKASSLGQRGKKIYDHVLEHTNTIDDCFYANASYTGSGKFLSITNSTDYRGCQQTCQYTVGCEYFNWRGGVNGCMLLDQNAAYTDERSQGIIAGPKVCPDVTPACTDLPGPGFPGNTARASNLAWPSHRAPAKLECWPKNETGGWYDSCPILTVLEDVNGGWPAKCTNMKEVLVPYKESCESFCRKSVKCSAWMLTDEDYPKCFHARLKSGIDCYTTDWRNRSVNSVGISGAQRIMHGEVRKLLDLTGVQIIGLVQAFDETYFLNVTIDAVKACRNVCYSNIVCDFWQYSKKSGCWIEDVTRGWVEHPLTNHTFLNDTAFAKTVVAGEYIQHVCVRTSNLNGYFLPAAATQSTTPSQDVLRNVTFINMQSDTRGQVNGYFSKLLSPEAKWLGALLSIVGLVFLSTLVIHKVMAHKVSKVLPDSEAPSQEQWYAADCKKNASMPSKHPAYAQIPFLGVSPKTAAPLNVLKGVYHAPIRWNAAMGPTTSTTISSASVPGQFSVTSPSASSQMGYVPLPLFPPRVATPLVTPVPTEPIATAVPTEPIMTAVPTDRSRAVPTEPIATAAATILMPTSAPTLPAMSYPPYPHSVGAPAGASPSPMTLTEPIATVVQRPTTPLSGFCGATRPTTPLSGVTDRNHGGLISRQDFEAFAVNAGNRQDFEAFAVNAAKQLNVPFRYPSR